MTKLSEIKYRDILIQCPTILLHLPGFYNSINEINKMVYEEEKSRSKRKM